MKSLEAVVSDMLDGRENDENITVEVSLLWSLVQRIERLRRIEEAARAVVASGESYSSEDRWGVYPLGLFAEVDALRAALEEKP